MEKFNEAWVAEEIEATSKSKSKICYPADEQADGATGKCYCAPTKEGNPIYLKKNQNLFSEGFNDRYMYVYSIANV